MFDEEIEEVEKQINQPDVTIQEINSLMEIMREAEDLNQEINKETESLKKTENQVEEKKKTLKNKTHFA